MSTTVCTFAVIVAGIVVERVHGEHKQLPQIPERGHPHVHGEQFGHSAVQAKQSALLVGVTDLDHNHLCDKVVGLVLACQHMHQ